MRSMLGFLTWAFTFVLGTLQVAQLALAQGKAVHDAERTVEGHDPAAGNDAASDFIKRYVTDAGIGQGDVIAVVGGYR